MTSYKRPRGWDPPYYPVTPNDAYLHNTNVVFARRVVGGPARAVHQVVDIKPTPCIYSWTMKLLVFFSTC